jgi:hypothetical protein
MRKLKKKIKNVPETFKKLGCSIRTQIKVLKSRRGIKKILSRMSSKYSYHGFRKNKRAMYRWNRQVLCMN